MKIIALEEHFVTTDVTVAWQALDPGTRDPTIGKSSDGRIAQRLLDVADLRTEAMDKAGIDVQVLSLTAPGLHVLPADKAAPLSRKVNDCISALILTKPDRFQGFATIATTDPGAAATELRRAVVELGLNGAMLFGRTGDRNLDHPDFLPILETAAELRAPVYIHPQTPTISVRDAYYGGLPDDLSAMFATSGLGWHYETGIQALRLILAGVFDRLPDLQVILGHWGEVVMFYLDRIDQMKVAAHLPHPISSYFRSNMSVTPSGIFSQRYLRWAEDVIGVDRILFSADYPFIPLADGAAKRFLTESGLEAAVQDKIASGNWHRLCANIRR